MRILHICNDFSYSKVHTNLYQSLDKNGITQIIYHPLRHTDNIGKNTFEFSQDDSKVVYSKIMKPYHRVFFRKKIQFLYEFLVKETDLSNIDLIHATTLFSDGAVAYRAYKEFGIPYVVTLRNTDINLFLKLRPDLYSLGKKILVNAKSVIFLSPSLKALFFEHFYYKNIQKSIEHKVHVIPNAIDDFWTNNINHKTQSNGLNFLFIGRFDSNKNVIRLIKGLTDQRRNYNNIHLHLVGGTGNKHNEVLQYVKKYNWITYHGAIYDKEKLKNVFSKCDFFAMASIYESFGLVYLEALSQGLPLLYTKGQGIDGVIPFEIGVATDPKSTEDISKGIAQLIRSRNTYLENISKIDFNRFRWNYISKIMVNIYCNI